MTCPSGAAGPISPKTVIAEKCTGCGKCVDVCPNGCRFLREADDLSTPRETPASGFEQEGQNVLGRDVRIRNACPCLDPCPGDAVFRYIGGKWKLKILCTLHYNEAIRYSDIKRLVAGISPTMLASSLRELEECGLVLRTIFDTMPVRVEYRLTEAGRSLVPILIELRDWAVSYSSDTYTEISS